ncbi:MAG: DEAD/DEAH box helicase, partial [Clostridiales bacterium]|nr:DEAD/DEAH box helicase [Clostridiales bacterium]
MLPFLEIKHLDKTYADLFSAIRERKKINVLSMTESARPHAAAVLGRFVLYVARDRASAELARERLSRFFSERTLVLRPKDDFLLFKRGVSGVLTERAEVLKELAYGTAGALVISAESLMERFPKKKLFCEFSVRLASGEDYDLYEAASRLTAAGYTRVERISAVGEFSVRGDILDVFYAEKSAVRVNFFGDTVESVRKIDPESMIGIRELKEIVLAPFSEILINPDQIPLVSERIGRQDIPKGADRLRITGVRENALIRLSGGSYAGFDWILPFLPENTSDIFEWLPRDAVVLIDEPNTVHERVKGYYKEFYDRVAGLVRSGEIFPCHKDAALAEESYAAGLKAFSAVSFLSISSYNPYYIPEETIGMPSVKLPSYYNDFNLLLGDIRSFLKLGKRVALCAGDRDKREILYRNLCDKMSRVTKSDGADGDFSGAVVLPCQIGEGFSIEKSGLVVIGESELFKKEKRVIRTNKSEAGYIPSAGDFVVHDVHGIGKFVGIERVKTGDLVRDYGRVIYREDQVLFIPVENLDKLIRYTGGGEPKLSKMGGAEFAKVKESVRRSVKELAFSLTELYRSREKTEGYIYSPDTEWQREFEESFEFDETEDQLTAVAEIKNDLESGKIMDRLLCGDVGYGKTEVALRAIFKVVTDGKQAAILAPTTILVRQHYNTILARTKDFKFNVGVLSRFESREEIAKTLTELKEGKLNIVVATHRLLSSDVNFYDLGLLVLDEEQRFGVEHKEKIKTIKNDVNVLTLSATPIPRTLHMALSGIRDISLLATPPQNRIPVETYVVEYSEGLVKDAVLREKGRGGQTFILYNRVESIDSFAYGISKLFNEEDNVRITVAHGQM